MAGKKGLDVLVALGKPKGDGDAEPEGDEGMGEDIEGAAAGDIIAAVKSGDAGALADGLRRFVSNCMKDYESDEGESGEP